MKIVLFVALHEAPVFFGDEPLSSLAQQAFQRVVTFCIGRRPNGPFFLLHLHYSDYIGWCRNIFVSFNILFKSIFYLLETIFLQAILEEIIYRFELHCLIAISFLETKNLVKQMCQIVLSLQGFLDWLLLPWHCAVHGILHGVLQ